MKIIETKAPIFVFEMADMKDEILTAIESMGTHSLIDDRQQISNSDWHLNANYPRPYYDMIFPCINENLSELNTKMKCNIIDIDNYWFQQYESEDYHSWHHHGKCTFSSVYYVELPEQTSTTFEYMGNEFEVDVEEGDYLIFPSYLRHCSKPNKTGKRKTIIALNLNIN